jgi:hypothetical protein
MNPQYECLSNYHKEDKQFPFHHNLCGQYILLKIDVKFVVKLYKKENNHHKPMLEKVFLQCDV